MGKTTRTSRSLLLPATWRRNVLFCAGALLALAALLPALSGCGRGKAAPPAAQAAAATTKPVYVVAAKRGDIQDLLEITGTTRAYNEVDVVAEMSGKVTRVTCDVGDRVNAGQLLVQLDTDIAEQQRVQADRSLDSSRAQLVQSEKSAQLTDRETSIAIRQAEQGVAAATQQLRKAETGYRLTADQTSSSIEQAKVALSSAQAQERDVAAGARTQEIAQAEASVRQAEADLSYKKTNFDRYQRLFTQGAVAQATLDTYRTQYEVAQQSVNQARESLSLAREGARQEQKRVATLAVDRAREQLRLAQAGRKQNDMSARDLESARVGLRQAEENLRMARASRKRYEVSLAGVSAARAGVGQAAAGRSMASTSLRKYSIYAPISGVVASRAVDVGEGASTGMAVMRIVDSNPILVNCTVSELDIAKVRLGDEAETSVDGLVGKSFFGRVKDIAPQATQDQRNYNVRVEVDNPEGLIKSGMFARVHLVVGSKSDVVVLSRDCLLERGSQRKAYIVDNGVVKVREVKVGISSGPELEIVSGVSAGEMVVAEGQAMLADGEQVKPVQRSAGAAGAGEAPDAAASMGQPAPSAEVAGPPEPPPAGAPH
jgi:HlyD family secretion protein